MKKPKIQNLEQPSKPGAAGLQRDLEGDYQVVLPSPTVDDAAKQFHEQIMATTPAVALVSFATRLALRLLMVVNRGWDTSAKVAWVLQLAVEWTRNPKLPLNYDQLYDEQPYIDDPSPYQASVPVARAVLECLANRQDQGELPIFVERLVRLSADSPQDERSSAVKREDDEWLIGEFRNDLTKLRGIPVTVSNFDPLSESLWGPLFRTIPPGSQKDLTAILGQCTQLNVADPPQEAVRTAAVSGAVEPPRSERMESLVLPEAAVAEATERPGQIRNRLKPSIGELTELRRRMREAIDRSHKTYEEIGIAMGVDSSKNPTSVVYWLLTRSADPGVFTLQRFAAAVNVSFRTLLQGLEQFRTESPR